MKFRIFIDWFWVWFCFNLLRTQLAGVKTEDSYIILLWNVNFGSHAAHMFYHIPCRFYTRLYINIYFRVLNPGSFSSLKFRSEFSHSIKASYTRTLFPIMFKSKETYKMFVMVRIKKSNSISTLFFDLFWYIFNNTKSYNFHKNHYCRIEFSAVH